MHMTKLKLTTVTGVALAAVALMSASASFEGSADRPERGLISAARTEPSAAGVDRYFGGFTPAASTDVGDGWTKHTFDPEGGARWQHSFDCNILSEDQEPTGSATGIFDFDNLPREPGLSA
jgi:hypothetical protein